MPRPAGCTWAMIDVVNPARRQRMPLQRRLCRASVLTRDCSSHGLQASERHSPTLFGCVDHVIQKTLASPTHRRRTITSSPLYCTVSSGLASKLVAGAEPAEIHRMLKTLVRGIPWKSPTRCPMVN